jgi:hypothetical protein
MVANLTCLLHIIFAIGLCSDACCIRLTSIYQYREFFVSCEGSFVRAVGYMVGEVFSNHDRNPA